MGREASRRHVLAGLGAASATSVAGCTGLPFLGNGSGDDGRDYSRWMRSDPDVEALHLDFSVVEPAALEAHREDLPNAFTIVGQPYVPPDRATGEVGFGADYGDVEAVVGVGDLQRNELGSHVLAGPYERDALEAYLAGASYEHHSTYEGFDVWGRHIPDIYPSRGDRGRFTVDQIEEGQAVAFDGDLLVTGVVTYFNQITMVEATVDAIESEADRYAAANDAGAELLEHLATGQVRVGRTHEELTAEWAADVRGWFAGQVATGTRFDVRGETTELRSVRVFADRDHVDVDAVRGWADSLPSVIAAEGGGTARPYHDLEARVERRGRSVVVTGTMPTADLTMGYWP